MWVGFIILKPNFEEEEKGLKVKLNVSFHTIVTNNFVLIYQKP